ncbi:MAG: glycosyltransferase family 2 protein, partial [Gammaproteobacteria bacterium]
LRRHAMEQTTATVGISVVVPVYMNAGGLEEFFRRVRPVLEAQTPDWELIMVDDGSTDGSFAVLQKLRALDPRVKLIQFGHNHGQHHAVLCGLQHSRGQAVITLDDDLQNPPEEIPRFLASLGEGHHIVIGRIAEKKQHVWFRNIGSRTIQNLASVILNKPKHLALSSYRGLSRRAVDAISAYKGVHPYLPALMLGSVPTDAIVNIDVRHDPRHHGKSTYSLRKLLRLSSYLLINHSFIPLRMMIYWGMLVSVASLAFAVYVALRALLWHHTSVLGWPSLAILLSFFSGNILLALGVLGEYIGRLVQESATNLQFYIFRKDF